MNFFIIDDQSQNWAAAAALWAQQRQVQEHGSNSATPLPLDYERPPEPPGPPPLRPPLPSMELPPIAAPAQSIEVHDYMHGKGPPAPQQPEVIDYQHGKVGDPHPPTNEFNNMKHNEEHPVEYEVTSDNWQDHKPLFYNGGWNQDGWNGDQMNYYAAAAQHYQNEYNNSPTPTAPMMHIESDSRSHRSNSVTSGSYKNDRHGQNGKVHVSKFDNTKPSSIFPGKLIT